MLFRALFVSLLMLAFASPGFAWNRAGHMVTGAMTYAILEKDAPEVLAKALVILKAHPQYDKLWKAQVEKRPVDERDIYLFMLAGRWADDIRGNKDYDQPIWHYINYAFKPAGQPDSVVTLPPDEKGNIVKAYGINFDKLKAAPEAVDGAVPICWLFHLVGDVHMPLHSVSLFTEKYPTGDRGGNLFFVKVKPESRAINLHAYWDNLIIGSDDFRDVRNKAIELRLRPEFARDKLTELSEKSFENWAKVESAELARTAVYREGKLAGGTGELNAEVLPEDYPKITQPLAERRAVLASYRLAEVLKAALGG
jgi:S1/P1 Nuclease